MESLDSYTDAIELAQAHEHLRAGLAPPGPQNAPAGPPEPAPEPAPALRELAFDIGGIKRVFEIRANEYEQAKGEMRLFWGKWRDAIMQENNTRSSTRLRNGIAYDKRDGREFMFCIGNEDVDDLMVGACEILRKYGPAGYRTI